LTLSYDPFLAQGFEEGVDKLHAKLRLDVGRVAVGVRVLFEPLDETNDLFGRSLILGYHLH